MKITARLLDLWAMFVKIGARVLDLWFGYVLVPVGPKLVFSPHTPGVKVFFQHSTFKEFIGFFTS